MATTKSNDIYTTAELLRISRDSKSTDADWNGYYIKWYTTNPWVTGKLGEHNEYTLGTHEFLAATSKHRPIADRLQSYVTNVLGAFMDKYDPRGEPLVARSVDPFDFGDDPTSSDTSAGSSAPAAPTRPPLRRTKHDSALFDEPQQSSSSSSSSATSTTTTTTTTCSPASQPVAGTVAAPTASNVPSNCPVPADPQPYAKPNGPGIMAPAPAIAAPYVGPPAPGAQRPVSGGSVSSGGGPAPAAVSLSVTGDHVPTSASGSGAPGLLPRGGVHVQPSGGATVPAVSSACVSTVLSNDFPDTSLADAGVSFTPADFAVAGVSTGVADLPHGEPTSALLTHVPYAASLCETNAIVTAGEGLEFDYLQWYDILGRFLRWFTVMFIGEPDTVWFKSDNGIVFTRRVPLSYNLSQVAQKFGAEYWKASLDFDMTNYNLSSAQATSVCKRLAVHQKYVNAQFTLPLLAAQFAYENRRKYRGPPGSRVPRGTAVALSLVCGMLSAVIEECVRSVMPLLTTLVLAVVEAAARTSYHRLWPVLVHVSLFCVLWWHQPVESWWSWAYDRTVGRVFDVWTTTLCTQDRWVIEWLPTGLVTCDDAYTYPWFVWSPFQLSHRGMSINVILHVAVNIIACALGITQFSLLMLPWRVLRRHNLRLWSSCRSYLPDSATLPRAKLALTSSVRFLWKLRRDPEPDIQYAVGLCDESNRPVFHTNSEDAQLQALSHRMLKATPVPNGADISSFTAWSLLAVHHLCPRACANRVSHVDIDEYIANTNATGQTLAALRREAQRMKDENFDFDKPIPKREAYRMMERSCFVKVENLALRSGGVAKEKAPRAIQGLGPRAAIVLGCTFAAITKAFKRDLSSNSTVCFASGTTTKETADVITSGGGVFVKNDVSTFDASICRDLAEMEVDIAEKFGACAAALSLMRANVDLHGRTSRGFRFFGKARGSLVMLIRLFSIVSSTCFSIATSLCKTLTNLYRSSFVRSECSSSAMTMSRPCQPIGHDVISMDGSSDLDSSPKPPMWIFWMLSFVLCGFILSKEDTCSAPRLAASSPKPVTTYHPPLQLNRSHCCVDLFYQWPPLLASVSHTGSLWNVSYMTRGEFAPTTPAAVTGQWTYPPVSPLQTPPPRYSGGMGGTRGWPPSSEKRFGTPHSVEPAWVPFSATYVTSTVPEVTRLNDTLRSGDAVAPVKTCPEADVGVVIAHASRPGRGNRDPEQSPVSNQPRPSNPRGTHVAPNTSNPRSAVTRSQRAHVRGGGSLPKELRGDMGSLEMSSNTTKKAAKANKIIKKDVTKIVRAAKQRAMTGRSPVLHGRGGFWGDLWDGVKKGVSYAVDNVPKFISVAREVAPLLAGFGKYTVRKNSFMSYANHPSTRRLLPAGVSTESGFPTTSPPVFASTGVGSDCEISHSEFVANVYSSTGFNKTTYLVNAGNPALFPWFSQMAGLYEEYELLGMVFEYRPTSAKAVGTTSAAMGVVLIASDYDCYDDAFVSKRAAEAAEYCSPGAPYEHLIHPVECDRSRNVLAKEYVVPGATMVSQLPGDARMSAYCLTSVITEGQQTAGTAIGELHVSYHVRLSRPILEGNPTSNFSQHVSYTVNSIGNAALDSSTVVGSGFEFSQPYGSTDRNVRIIAPLSSPRIGGSYLLTVIASALSASTWDGSTAALPNLVGSAQFLTLLRGDTTQLRTQTGFATVDTNTGLATFNKTAAFKVTSDLGGLELLLPMNLTQTIYVDIFVTPLSSSLTGDSRMGRIMALTQSRRTEDVVDQLRKELAAVKTQLRSSPDCSAAARPVKASSVADDPPDDYDDVDPDKIADLPDLRPAHSAAAKSTAQVAGPKVGQSAFTPK